MSILTDSSKSTTVPTVELKPKSQNTRGYMTGQKMTPQQMETEIIRLSKTHTVSEIIAITGKSKRTILRIRQKAKQTGKIITGESGRVTLPQDELAKRQYQSITRDELCEKYQPVKKWIDQRIGEAQGKKKQILRARSQLGKIKIICDTLRLNPYSMLSSGDDGTSYGGLTTVMTAFSTAMVEGRVVYQQKNQKQPDPENIDSAFREIKMACRNFATYNGVTIPKLPKNHILSGKKVGFGKYAHIKMTHEEINQCIELLSEKFGKDSIQVAMFVFYYLTGSRALSIYDIKISTVETDKNGWITCRVYESKTEHTWQKFIPNDNPHFNILQDWFYKRKKEGKQFIFSEIGECNADLHKDLIVNLKIIYEKVGLKEDYFYNKPLHTLRHVAAHYWLGRCSLNHVAVAKILGWLDVQTLISCYGEISNDQIYKIATGGIEL